MCRFGCPSLPPTGRRNYGGPLPLVSGREVLYIRLRKESLGCYSLLLEGQLLQPPPGSIPGGGNSAACRHKKVRVDAQGEEGALPMGLGGVLRSSLRGIESGLLPLGSGIHGGGDVLGDEQVQ